MITDPEARLVDGLVSNEGRVEIGFNGVWRTVCDDSWTNEDAQVICRQLELPHEGAVALTNAFFGQGSGDVVMDEVDCEGHESHIGECPHNGWGDTDCDHSKDAGVICTDDGKTCFEYFFIFFQLSFTTLKLTALTR